MRTIKELLLVAFTVVLFPVLLHAEELSGGVVYEQHCGRCHNFRPPNERSDNDWSIIVAHMRTTGMMTGDQSAAVLRFLQESNNPVINTAYEGGDGSFVSSGKELFAKNQCMGCHTLRGSGGNVGPGLDEVFARRSIDFVKSQIQNPRQNNPTSIMPGYNFSEADLKRIIEYLRDGE